MLRAMVLVLLLFIATPAARGAEVATAAKNKALMFKFSGLSQLGIQGPNGGVGFRYYLRDRLALRPTLSFGWTRRRERPPAVDPGQPRASNTQHINTSVSLEVALEKHLSGPANVSPYVGVGVYGTHFDYKTEPSVLPDSPAGTVTKITERGTDGSVFAMLGFEWGWTESMTLGGETRFGLNIDARKQETERIQTPDRLSNETYQYRVGFDTVSLFLSVHW